MCQRRRDQGSRLFPVACSIGSGSSSAGRRLRVLCSGGSTVSALGRIGETVRGVASKSRQFCLARGPASASSGIRGNLFAWRLNSAGRGCRRCLAGPPSRPPSPTCAAMLRIAFPAQTLQQDYATVSLARWANPTLPNRSVPVISKWRQNKPMATLPEERPNATTTCVIMQLAQRTQSMRYKKTSTMN